MPPFLSFLALVVLSCSCHVSRMKHCRMVFLLILVCFFSVAFFVEFDSSGLFDYEIVMSTLECDDS